MAGNAPSIRNEIADFLNVGSPDTPEWELMGAGFTALNENPNAQMNTVAYINDRASSTTIIGYQPQFPFTVERIVSRKAVMAIVNVGRNQLTGENAQAQYLRVETDMPIAGQQDVFAARLFNVAVEVTGTTGEGAQKIVNSGNLNQIGDFIDGTYNRTSKTFTSFAVSSVTVEPAATSVTVGGTQAFAATVAGDPTPVQTVTWSLTGNASTTTTVSNAGLLTVGSDETATALTVTATSTVDTTKSGSAAVTVTEA